MAPLLFLNDRVLTSTRLQMSETVDQALQM